MRYNFKLFQLALKKQAVIDTTYLVTGSAACAGSLTYVLNENKNNPMKKDSETEAQPSISRNKI